MKGSYILVVYLACDKHILIGALGQVLFMKGFFFYVGSAMGEYGATTLENRVKRHLLPPEKKKPHWHIDFFLEDPATIITRLYLVPSLIRLECILAKELDSFADSYIENFGSSDCVCKSHLFYFKNFNPIFLDNETN